MAAIASVSFNTPVIFNYTNCTFRSVFNSNKENYFYDIVIYKCLEKKKVIPLLISPFYKISMMFDLCRLRKLISSKEYNMYRKEIPSENIA